MTQATARAHPNIAFIKYWGNADDTLRLPVNSSISMNLDGLHAETTVTFDDSLTSDTLTLNGNRETGQALTRVVNHMNRIRQRLEISTFANIVSANNFPTGTGIASSAAAFAALTVAAVTATGTELSERELSTIARTGSGSASRSVPAGFVEWYKADTHEASYAETVATPDHWDLVDVIAIVSDQHKKTGSQTGHTTAKTSDLQDARVAGAQDRLDTVRQAILDRDFPTFADVVEKDSNLMHAIMMTSNPPLFYWKPTTLTVMELVREWRSEGLSVCYTLDAGPNIHCICTRNDAQIVRDRLQQVSGIMDIRIAGVGGKATVISE
ncbi:MAG: diphosphomevalonate decarboxylase [Chloroflexota bacterium]